MGVRFSAHVQAGPEDYAASCTMGAGSFPGVKRPGRGVKHPPPSSVKVKERVELTSTRYIHQRRVSRGTSDLILRPARVFENVLLILLPTF